MFKLSCTNTMVPGETLIQKAKFIQDCGFDAMSVFFDIENWNEEVENDLFNVEAETGIKICEFCFGGGLYGRLMDPDTNIRKDAIGIYEKTIEIGNKLGTVSEMEYLYQPRNPVPLLDVYQKMSIEDTDYYCKLYKSLSSKVTGGAQLLLEPINRYEEPYLNTIEENVKIIDMVNAPHTGILFDTYHVNMEERDVVDTFKKYHSYVKHIHLGDNNRLLPGKGNIPWPRFFEALIDNGYDGYCNLECAIIGDNVREQLLKTSAFINSLI